MRFLSVLLCAFLTGIAPAVAQTAQPLKILYYERHPFHYTGADGKIAGLVGTPTIEAFRKAGLPVRWELVPASRILAEIKANREAVCSTGWFEDGERDSFARFTLPVYTSLPPVGLVRADFPLPDGVAADALLKDPKTRLVLKQSLSYGSYLDGLVAKMPRQQIDFVTTEYVNMIKMIKGGHADLMIETAEQVDMTIKEAGFKPEEFRIIRFSDVTALNKRRIMCSQKVPAGIIDRLNDAIGAAPAPIGH